MAVEPHICFLSQTILVKLLCLLLYVHLWIRGMTSEFQKKFNISKPLEKPILCIWGTNICALNYLHNSYTLLVRLFLNLLRANTLNLISVFEQSPIFTDLLQLDLRTFGWKFQMIHLFFFLFLCAICWDWHFRMKLFTANEDPLMCSPYANNFWCK